MADTITLVNDWGQKKEYQAGVSKVAIYIEDSSVTTAGHMPYSAPVAWDGVTAMNLAPSGAEITKIYADNEKYLDLQGAEEFGFTIEAYTYPEEFNACNGEEALGDNIAAYVAQQVRKKFCLTFRTELGTDTKAAGASDGDYYLHIIYNATAQPSASDFATISDSPEAATMSWECSCSNAPVENKKGTAHIKVKCTSANKDQVFELLKALYGYVTVPEGGGEGTKTEGYMPTPDQIKTLLTPPSPGI